ncbi:MAG: hypothetical protein PHW17_12460 [Desulfobacterales bacterium]|nr:hypothetical protein [Desulfobacterales bacterium]
MAPTLEKIKNDENGYVLLAVMLMLVLLTVIGIAATNTSHVEMQISSNVSRIANGLYRSESALMDQMENFGDWLTHDFLADGEEGAHYQANIDVDNDGANEALVEARCVVDEDVTLDSAVTDTLSANANDLPVQLHAVNPPVNSGYSVKYFQARRFGLTATASDPSAVVQIGVWKVFPK